MSLYKLFEFNFYLLEHINKIVQGEKKEERKKRKEDLYLSFKVWYI